MRVWGVTTAVLLGFAASATGAPLDVKQVSAEAKWMVHVDVDAMRESTLVHRIYDKWVAEWPNAERRLAELTDLVEHLGIDLKRDLHGLTAYGMKVGKPDGVFIVAADVDQKMLLDKAEQAPDHQITTYGSYELHSWTDAKGRRHEHPMVGTLYKPNVMIFAPTVEQIKAALDVLDGKSPSLAGKSPLGEGTPAGTMVVIRAAGLAGAKLPWKSPLVTQSEMLSLAIGEREGTVSLQAALATKSKETADQVKAIVEGIRAMVEVQLAHDAEAMKIVKALKVTAADKAVSIQFSAPVDALWAHAEKAAKELRKHRQKHAERQGSAE